MFGVIIVAYKNPARTADYINNQLSKLVNSYVVVVVNNASTIAECESLASLCNGVACEADDNVGRHDVYIVHSAENLGFARGNNLGVDFLAQNNPCEYLLFSNDDIILDTGTDLQPMINLLCKDKSIGAIGPNIVDLDGLPQSPHYHIISPYRQIGWILLSRFRKRKKEKDTSAQIRIALEGKCYWVSGAFFLMSNEDFASVNGFDSDTFLYTEEAILAERLKIIDKQMYFYPGIKIVHLEGGTTKENYNRADIRKIMVDSNCVYYRKYLKIPYPVVEFYRWLSFQRLDKANK